MCYVPPSVELLGATTPSVFKPGSTTQRFQTRLTPLALGYALQSVVMADVSRNNPSQEPQLLLVTANIADAKLLFSIIIQPKTGPDS